MAPSKKHLPSPPESSGSSPSLSRSRQRRIDGSPAESLPVQQDQGWKELHRVTPSGKGKAFKRLERGGLLHATCQACVVMLAVDPALPVSTAVSEQQVLDVRAPP